MHPQPPADDIRIVHGRAEPHPAQIRREGLQAGEIQGQKVAALGGVDGVDLVDDHAGQALEIEPRALPGAEQRQLLGGGQEDVRRLHPLALAARDPGVAGAALGDDGQAHLEDRRHQVALDVDGQGLER